MTIKRSIISVLILFSLILSMTYGIGPVLAVESSSLPIDNEGEEPVIDENRAPTEDLDITDFIEEENSVETGDLTQQSLSVLSVNNTAIEQFVTRLYSEILGRNPEPGGFAHWTNELVKGAPGALIAHGFFFSPEFQRRPLTPEQYIDIHYRTLLNRNAESGGRTHWVDLLKSGLPREDIFSGFVNSKEFTDLCTQYGIVRGTYTPPAGGVIKMFVTRLYREMLGRDPDSAGLNSLTNNILNGATGAFAASRVLFSAEMDRRNLSNGDYVEVLFKSLYNRSSTALEKNALVEQLNRGTSKFEIYAGFIKSNEFIRQCRNFNIIPGRAIDPAKPIIALTYDDGPTNFTNQLIDLLSKNNASATFYFTGTNASADRATVLRAFDMGNEIGNHGWTYVNPTTISLSNVRDEIINTGNLIQSITGVKPATYRPSYGQVNSNVVTVAVEHGVSIINWTLMAELVANYYTHDAAEVANHVIQTAKSGDIVLLHDTYADVIPATERIIAELTKKGFQFVTVSELFLYSNIRLAPGQFYGDVW